MTLCVAKTWVPSAYEWDDAWINCPYSTYFQSREWAETWAVYSDGKITPAPLGVALSDGTRIVLPFSREKLFRGLASRYISSPAGTFGGWLADNSLDDQHQSLLIDLVSSQYSDLIWRLNPYEKLIHTKRLGHMTKDETYCLDLSIGLEKIYRCSTKGHSSAVRKARKAGVEIELAETSEDWKHYFHVYQDSLERWGVKARVAYTQYLFDLLFLCESPNIKLWLARHDGLVIAGALCFYSPSHVVYWHGAALSSHFNLRPVHLLIYEVIKDAEKRNSRWFDFNPSGGLDGVKAFKRSFGAVPLESNVLSLISSRQQLIGSIRSSFAWLKKGDA